MGTLHRSVSNDESFSEADRNVHGDYGVGSLRQRIRSVIRRCSSWLDFSITRYGRKNQELAILIRTTSDGESTKAQLREIVALSNNLTSEFRRLTAEVESGRTAVVVPMALQAAEIRDRASMVLSKITESNADVINNESGFSEHPESVIRMEAMTDERICTLVVKVGELVKKRTADGEVAQIRATRPIENELPAWIEPLFCFIEKLQADIQHGAKFPDLDGRLTPLNDGSQKCDEVAHRIERILELVSNGAIRADAT